MSQKKIALKFPDFGPFLIFWTFGTLLDNFGFWITQILTLLDFFSFIASIFSRGLLSRKKNLLWLPAAFRGSQAKWDQRLSKQD